MTTTSRGIALFLGLFTLLNLAGEWRVPGFDANLWWIDLRALPWALSRALLASFALASVGWALRPDANPWRSRTTSGLLLAVLGLVLWDAGRFFLVLARGRIAAGFPLPFSMFVAAALGLVLYGLRQGPAAKSPEGSTATAWRGRANMAGVTAVSFAVFACLQMACYGKTDYRRPGGAAVVFGARVFRDGQLSDALKDRVRTACELYRQGLVRGLVMSGGPGDGDIHETEAMRRYAVELGVPAEVIAVDLEGLNTDATVANTAAALDRLGLDPPILAVSHWYHLPRIKLTYARAGMPLYTVPAREAYVLKKTPWYLAREVAAFWVYYLRCLVR